MPSNPADIDHDLSDSPAMRPQPGGAGSRTVCSNCRQRKVRCDRSLPSCGFCNKNRLDCQYTVAKKPGLRAGYVSSLERRLTDLENEINILKARKSSPVPSRSDSITVVAQPQGLTENPSPRITRLFSISNLSSKVAEFLRPDILAPLCFVWYDRFHPCLPILHRMSFEATVASQDTVLQCHQRVIFEAVVAVTVPYWAGDSLSPEAQHDLGLALREEVLTKAMASLSLPSMQATLILSTMDYGNGRVADFWNLIAISKRMGTQLGLRDLVVHHGQNFNTASSLPPRMLPLPPNVIDQEERIRVYWMAEILDSSTTVGASWNLGLTKLGEADITPCDDNLWTISSSDIMDTFESVDNFGSYVRFVGEHIWSVHEFTQEQHNLQSTEGLALWQARCHELDVKLSKFVDNLKDMRGDMTQRNSYLTTIRCICNSAIICMYQCMVVEPSAADHQSPWPHALERCRAAARDTADAIHIFPSPALEKLGPHIIFHLFTAARLDVVQNTAEQFRIDSVAHVLLYAIQILSAQWHLARILGKVLKMAMADRELPLAARVLPCQFYDLSYASIDVYEALRVQTCNL